MKLIFFITQVILSSTLLASEFKTIQKNFKSSNKIRSSYLMGIPKSGHTEQWGVLLYLNVSYAIEYPRIFEDLKKIAAKRKLIPVAVLSPGPGRIWWKNPSGNSVFLDELLSKEVFGKYKVDRNRVYFSGGSAGALFLGAYFLPIHGSKYSTGALLICGAGPNRMDQFIGHDNYITEFQLLISSTTSDPWLDMAKSASTYYSDLGMQVHSNFQTKGGHCIYQGGVAGEISRGLEIIDIK